ncbi:MAG: long-chain acyl-CoA synthetase [Gammaproteobacteria bacterium]|jgi:long-chain acyl-CoA synthetase
MYFHNLNEPIENLTFMQMIERGVAQHPFSSAVISDGKTYSYDEFWCEVNRIRRALQKLHVSGIALSAGNSIAWLVFDLAAIKENITVIPVPHFFSSSQVDHLMNDSKADALVADLSNELTGSDETSIPLEPWLSIFGTELYAIDNRHLSDVSQSPRTLPRTCKISYTSGTTGTPKGVHISFDSIDKTVHSLVETIGKDAVTRHLCALPFSMLLENVAGIYSVLACGGCCIVPSFSELGLAGSSKLDIARFSAVISTYEPTSMITVPAVLKGMLYGISQLNCKVSSLCFVALGGAPVSKKTLQDATDLGLPVFQGYGMTECGSVVCLNRPDEDRPGSVGKPLPHVSIRISDDDEIIVGGINFSGYTNTADPDSKNEWATGDTGYVDEQGYLYVTGRISSTYCTAFGRNLSPEWVECELNSQVEIAQSAVFGEGMIRNIAVIVPYEPNMDEKFIANAIRNTNSRLPDYAVIGDWVIAKQPFARENNLLSPGGGIRRDRIFEEFHQHFPTKPLNQKVSNHEVI